MLTGGSALLQEFPEVHQLISSAGQNMGVFKAKVTIRPFLLSFSDHPLKAYQVTDGGNVGWRVRRTWVQILVSPL